MKNNKRLVFFRLGAIGDVIHTLPLVRYVRKEFPDALIEYITSSDIAELLKKNCNFINKVWTASTKDKYKICMQIANNNLKVDYFFNLQSSLILNLISPWLTKAQEFFQYKKQKNIHAVLNFARTYKNALTLPELEHNTLFGDNSDELLKKHGLKENYYVCFVIGVGNNRPHRAWPLKNWIMLAEEFLSGYKEFKITLLGGENERKIVTNEKKLQEINPELKNKIINLTGCLTLSENANLMSKAAVIISCDTGLLHIAAALSRKVIGLFGPTDLNRTGPFCNDFDFVIAENCQCLKQYGEVKKCKLTSLSDSICMSSISVNSVLRKLKAGL